MKYVEYGGILKYGDLLNGFLQYGDMGGIPSDRGAVHNLRFFPDRHEDDRDFEDMVQIIVASGVLN